MSGSVINSLKKKIKKKFPALTAYYRSIKYIFRIPEKIFNSLFPVWSLEVSCKKKKKLYEEHSRLSLPQIEEKISDSYSLFFLRPLNWDNPQAYTEKLNVSKLYGASPIKTQLADKYLVREWVKSRIGDEYLVPLIGVYDSFDEIDFDALPSKFVIKCNHDCGSSTVIRDKRKINMKALKIKYDFCMNRNYALMAFEMQYRDIKPKIIIEKYIDYIGERGTDYKFFCFDGKPYYCRILIDNMMNFYDMDWNLQPFTWAAFGFYPGQVSKPDKYDEMKEIAGKLSDGFDHVRVDMYLAGGHIYFGEMTFTTMGGNNVVTPDEWDFRLGSLWNFDNSIRSRALLKLSKTAVIPLALAMWI